MKVICIKQGEWIDNISGCKETLAPKYGEICTVTSELKRGFFELLEYPIDADGFRQNFSKKHFIPLSTIDEKEIIEQRQTQYA